MKKLIDPNGNVCDNIDNLLALTTRYFDSLFSSNGISNAEAIIEGVILCINATMNQVLTRVLSYKEVCLALKI